MIHMNKYLILSGFLLFVLMVNLSGCIVQETSGDTDRLKLINYNVETKKWDEGYKTIGKGFIHSMNAELYFINGTVKNIAGEMLNSVNITAKFYDDTNNFLREEITYLGGIPDTYTEDFGIYYFVNEMYFENVTSVKFVFEVT